MASQEHLKILLMQGSVVELQELYLSLRVSLPGATIMSAQTAEKGIELLSKEEPPDVIVLDPALPDADGLETVRWIRLHSDVPVIVVTDQASEMDIVKGLESGADDYVVKPFGHLELLARLRSVLRRGRIEAGSIPGVLSCGGLTVDPESEEVRLHGKRIDLTPTEYRLLWELASNAGRPMSQAALIESVWGEEGFDVSGSLKVHIHRLRRKLGDDLERPRIIATVGRRKYQFNGVHHSAK